MPFIDDEQLAALYKEVDQEKKASAFFQDLHQKNKQRLSRLKFYQYSAIISFLLFLASLVYFLSSADAAEVVTDTTLTERIAQLERENQLLGGEAEDLQEQLKTEKVFTVQIMASSDDDILLFSENFVNFRAHPLKEFNAYSLGNFSTEEEAEAFRQELMALGLPDVWVTAYQNGKRILIDRDE
jgi:hypothetical protein